MQVLISDTNIWIDLQHGGLLTEALTLPWQFVTTDFVYAELIQPPAQSLVNLGLVIVPLSKQQIQALHGLAAGLRNSSLADVSCYLLAQQNSQWRLLTGDGDVRKAAQRGGLQCHGILWLLDELFAAHPNKGHNLADALSKMLARGAWLPKDECEIRLARWTVCF